MSTPQDSTAPAGDAAQAGAGTPVRAPDVSVRREAVARVAELAIPVGGLGSLAELGCWLAACQGVCPPRPPVRSRV
ncbi:MAG: nicotinate-nucleotide--dimethylbenzimidazole phosphoribosyltransferase, partial [Actinomycetota bacterium]|nr:nicotinate-nucleotide--dimethylbenzimidazole phosphoribosyltransferase [Actinomycetota bacterium]